MTTMLEVLFIFSLGFISGYIYHVIREKNTSATPQRISKPLNQQQRLILKTMHQSDSDRIRELNTLNGNESAFLRLLKQVFQHHDIVVKNKRFFIIDQDHFPRAIFEYRDGYSPLKMEDREDDLPLFLYKALISSNELKKDHEKIILMQNSMKVANRS